MLHQPAFSAETELGALWVEASKHQLNENIPGAGIFPYSECNSEEILRRACSSPGEFFSLESLVKKLTALFSMPRTEDPDVVLEKVIAAVTNYASLHNDDSDANRKRLYNFRLHTLGTIKANPVWQPYLNASYDQSTNNITIEQEYFALAANSYPALLATVGHEVGHHLDPPFLKAKTKELLKQLKDNKSDIKVHDLTDQPEKPSPSKTKAKKAQNAAAEKKAKEERILKKIKQLKEILISKPYLEGKEYVIWDSTMFASRQSIFSPEQMSCYTINYWLSEKSDREDFADFFGTLVFQEYLKGLKSAVDKFTSAQAAVGLFCQDYLDLKKSSSYYESNSKDPHSKSEDRIKNIFQNPIFLESIGCKATPLYGCE